MIKNIFLNHKIAPALLVVVFLLGCNMPTAQQKDPMQLGTYLAPADSKGIRKKLEVESGVIMYYANAANATPTNTFTYRKVNKLAMDFDHIYTRSPDGQKLAGGNVTKRYNGLQLKATPLGAGSFYHLKTGTTNYMIVANYASGIIETLVVRPSGILMANSYIENDKYFPPEYGITGNPADKPGLTNVPASPKNITLYLDGQEADFAYKTTITGSEPSSPLQGVTWIRQ